MWETILNTVIASLGVITVICKIIKDEIEKKKGIDINEKNEK